MDDTETRKPVRAPAGDVDAVEPHLAHRGCEQSRAHTRHRGLAAPVRSEQREHLAGFEHERHVEQRTERPVPGTHVVELEERHRGRFGLRSHTRSPRYALRTASWANTSSVRPDA